MGVVLQFFVFTKKHLPHLKQILCHLYPPAIFSSAAKTDLSHFGHFGACGALKGIISSFYAVERAAGQDMSLKVIYLPCLPS